MLADRTADDDAIETWKGCDTWFPLQWWNDLEHGDIFIFTKDTSNEIAERLRELGF